MENTLQYKAALGVLNNPDERPVTNLHVITTLCEILGLPYPDEEGFVQKGDTPTVGDVQATHRKIMGRPSALIVGWFAARNNLRLALYYLEYLMEHHVEQNILHSMTESSMVSFISLFGNAQAVMELWQLTGIVPTLYVFTRSFGSSIVSREFRLELLSVVTIQEYGKEYNNLDRALMYMQKGNDVGMFELLIDRLLTIDGYRENIQQSLDTVLLRPFTIYGMGITPLKLKFVKVLEDRDFRAMPRGHALPAVSPWGLANLLSYYTEETDDDMYMWDYLTDEFGAVPDEKSLHTAISNGSGIIVSVLVENGIEPKYTDMISALNNDKLEIDAYLYPFVADSLRRELHDNAVTVLKSITSVRAMKRLFHYRRPSYEEIGGVLEKLYDAQDNDTADRFIGALSRDDEVWVTRRYM